MSPTTRGDLHGWQVQLAGASLTAPVTLTFPGSPAAGEPAPLVQYASTPDGDLTAVDDVHVTGSSASVSTTHFSFWFVTWWSSMTAKVKATWEQVMAPAAVGVAPSCTGSDQLKASGVSVTASADDRVAWCAGLSPAGKPRVSIVNARGYPMTVLATSHMVLTNPDNSWQTLFSRLLSTLGNGLVPAGMSRALLPAGGGFTFDDTGSDTQGLKVTEDFAAYQATSLLYAVDTVLTMGDLSGRTTTLEKVVEAFATTSACVSSSRDAAATQPANTDQVMAFMDAAVRTVSSCLGEVMKKVYQDKASPSLLAGLIWLFDGVKQVAAGASAIKDLVALAGNPFTIIVSPPAAPSSAPTSVPVERLQSVTAPAMCNRPATKLVNGVIQELTDQDGFTSIADGPGDTLFSLTGPAGPGGAQLTAVVFQCSAGGVGWPEVIGLYDSSLTLRGSINLGDLDGQEHSNVSALSIRSGVLHVDWFTNDTCHTGASVSVPRHGDFPVDGSWRAAAANLVTDPDPSPCGG